MTAVLQQSLSAKQSIHFMPTDVSDEAEYIKKVSTYILCISSALINEQKAIVDIMGIKPFFDVEVPETTTYPLSEYIKDLRDALKKDEAIIFHLWKDAIIHAEGIYSSIGRRDGNIGYTTNNDYLNALDKITDSTRSKLSNLLLELSKLNVEYRNAMYELIMQAQKCKPEITILKQYIFLYDLGSECRALMDFRNTWHKVVGLEFTHL
ncbi:17435_t:CDS:2 [Cetraspora pellucida]|uniref:17435_t:CDS:1 n=1 Tax=Cetraspora pellucida TaxID=1433469 RepID=A0A9N9HGM4_9GLOM|nr:17435_t:CDS:2 [Cetraspora pellucida]